MKRLPCQAGLLGLALLAASSAWSQGAGFSQIQLGRYLSKAGDCTSCHTAQGGKAFAGGYPMDTPFGTLYTPNITPDRETGIGKWSSDDFFKAMHQGMRRDGQYLYPACPYPWFTRLSRGDVDALKAYLDTLEPVRQENKPNALPWPLSWRGVMAGWNMLFFHEGGYVPDTSKTEEWNRGAYLVEGAGHCAACHTPKNILGASKKDLHLLGGDAGESWFAPSLAGDERDGLGKWTTQDIIDYLKSGANHETASAGPMTDVVVNSTQYMSDADLKAIAVYLKDLPAAGKDGQAGKAQVSEQVMKQGYGLYVDNCMACHMAKGEGLKNAFPPLKGSASIQAENAASLVQVVIAGDRMAATSSRPTGLSMPAFGGKLDDYEIAVLVNYIRNAWGNQASLIESDDVAKVRKAVKEFGPRHPRRSSAAQ